MPSRITVHNTPLLLPAVAIVVGIFLCGEFGIASAGLILLGVLLLAAAWYVLLVDSRWLARVVMVCVGLGGLGAVVVHVDRPGLEGVRFDERSYVVAHVVSEPFRPGYGGRYQVVTAAVLPVDTCAAGSSLATRSTSCAARGDAPVFAATSKPKSSLAMGSGEQKVQLMIDTSQQVERGQIIAFWTKPRHLPQTGYGRYLANHGYLYRAYVYRLDSLGNHLTAHQKLELWRDQKAQILNQADPSAIASSLVLGHKQSLGKKLRGAYQSVGMAHVLAVSGLHVGIVFMILNFCLGWVKLFGRGRVYLGVAVVVLMVGYAAMTGFSVSVVRAVIMFSMVQVGVMLCRQSSSLNTLSFAAIAILLLDPMSLYDLGFQLSFLAMLSILTLYPWLCGFYMPSRRALRWLYSLSLVTLTAQAGTIVLVAYTFGNVPLLGLVMTPFLWFTVPVIIVLGMGFMAFGWELIGKMMAMVCDVQNTVVEMVASPSWVQIQGVEMDAWVVWMVYGIEVLGVILLLRIEPKKVA